MVLPHPRGSATTPVRRGPDPRLRGWVLIVLGAGDAVVGRFHLHPDATPTKEEDAADAEGMIREDLQNKVIPMVALFPVYAFSRSFLHQKENGELSVTGVHAAERLENTFDAGRSLGVPYRVALVSFQFCSEFDDEGRRRIVDKIQSAETAHRARREGLTALQ